MKLIHCADLHLDSKMTANLSREKAKIRKNELLNTFNSMINYACENQVDGIIIAGDLYDTKNISATARNTVIGAIKAHPEIVFYYLKGNHDGDSLLNALDEIPDNLKLFTDKWNSYIKGNIVITGIELTKENYGAIYNSLLLDMENFNIVILHGQESNHKSKDEYLNINLRELKNRGIDYLALGHIHEYREAMLDSRGVYCYPGCLEGRGFDECGEHGFVLLNIDEEKRTFTRQFVPIAERILYEVEVDITGCMNTAEISDRIGNCLDGAFFESKNMIKIILTGKVDIECEKNVELLVKQFENDYFFLKIDDTSKFAVDYGMFMYDESLKGEFVRRVMAENDLEDDEKAAIIRYGIQALSGEEID